MLSGDSAILANAGHGDDQIGSGGCSISSEYGGDRRSYGGNRWPRQETLALLKIRPEMDAEFRNSSIKGPLWEQVSRKLVELGYHRNAKKYKEKFENVYKYHKRTKGGKPNGKTYKFFDQLQVFTIGKSPPSAAQPPPQPLPETSTLPWINVPDSPNPLSSSLPLNPFQNLVFSNFTSRPSTESTSTASDQETLGSRKPKRKLKRFFKRSTKDIINKQEELQRRFIETVEKRQQERIAIEESWRIQETARINREHEILIQERAATTAKDAALIALLQKISGQQISPAVKRDNGESHKSTAVASSSRWPKEEVEALIRIRANLDNKYEENGAKGRLWEEISAEMRMLGYNRSSKRCKEKWENINKYFKWVKESGRKRPQDSKTCPYFHQLDALYKEKSKNGDGNSDSVDVISSGEPLMVRLEQQWLQGQARQSLELNRRENMEEDEDEELYVEEENEVGGKRKFQNVIT